MPLTPTLEAEFARHRTVVRPRFISNSLEFMRRMLLEGMGVGFFTRLGFMDEIARGLLVHVPLAEPRLRNVPIGVLVARRRASPPSVQLVLDELDQQLGPFMRHAHGMK
jgi:DNA-binding transcriptional LysR family regulator